MPQTPNKQHPLTWKLEIMRF